MKTCAITGANGWLGRCVVAEFLRNGWQVRRLVRNPSGPDERRFVLGEDVAPGVLEGCAALVHCAYDFTGVRWPEIERTNVEGTRRLLAAAAKAGVGRLTVVSTMSAYPGCVSLYGRAKLAIEDLGRTAGALLVRPGLIWGDVAGGMYGKLVAQAKGKRFQVMPGGGRQVLQLVHERDLAEFIRQRMESSEPMPTQAITTAHPQPWTLRGILEAIAKAHGRKLTFVPVPWRPIWLMLKTTETLGLRLGFRSDSLVSLMSQSPTHDFAGAAAAGWKGRPFAPAKTE